MRTTPHAAAIAAALALLLVPAVVPAQETDAPMMSAVNGADLQWGPASPALDAGAQATVLEGDPTKEGPFTLRIRFPAGFEVRPHTHATVEHVTVLAGTFHVGMGEVMDRTVGLAIGPGGFAVVPTGMPHYAWTGDEAVELQIHGQGPFALNYVNPADDPRNRTAE